MNRRFSFAIILLLTVLLITTMSVFTVDQRSYAMVSQLGEIMRVIDEPGLHFKWPLIQNVHYFDKRIVTYDAQEPERYITSEKKPVKVDAFVKWRIIGVKQYYISVQGDETLAETRISQTVNAGLRDEFSKRTVHEVVSGQREKIMEQVRIKADQDLRSIGVQIVDVRLKRVDLPEEVSESIYRRMETERKRVANGLRSNGAAEAEKIKADADKQREVVVAEAYREAQKIKGSGDAKASAIYAGAFGQNPEFYAFYRSLEAYRQSFHSKNDMLILEPTGDFFKYMKKMGKSGK